MRLTKAELKEIVKSHFDNANNELQEFHKNLRAQRVPEVADDIWQGMGKAVGIDAICGSIFHILNQEIDKIVGDSLNETQFEQFQKTIGERMYMLQSCYHYPPVRGLDSYVRNMMQKGWNDRIPPPAYGAQFDAAPPPGAAPAASVSPVVSFDAPPPAYDDGQEIKERAELPSQGPKQPKLDLKAAIKSYFEIGTPQMKKLNDRLRAQNVPEIADDTWQGMGRAVGINEIRRSILHILNQEIDKIPGDSLNEAQFEQFQKTIGDEMFALQSCYYYPPVVGLDGYAEDILQECRSQFEVEEATRRSLASVQPVRSPVRSPPPPPPLRNR
jgi:hypothetical protein